MNKSESLIDQLYTDSGPFDKERVVGALKKVLAIQRGEHFVHFKKELPLKNEDKILAYALAKKLLSAEGAEEQSGFSGKEVHVKTGIPQGTVDPTIQKLKKDGILVGKGSNYEIPSHEIEAALGRLERYSEKK
jgi:biotin operon repressor